MPWVDDGAGQWVWSPPGRMTKPPSTPPPSAANSSKKGFNPELGETAPQMVAGGTVYQEQPVEPAPEPEPTPKPSDRTNMPTLEEVGAPVAAGADQRRGLTNDIVDRYSAVQMDTGPADRAREQQDRALGMQENIYDKLLNYDPEAAADAASKRAMNSALVMARSQGGGAGARQAAQFQALQQMPAIQSSAAQQAVDTQARNTQLAAQAAAGFAQTAQGQRGQDITQAQAQVDTGLGVANGIANALGRDMQLTSEEAQFLGKMQAELEKLNLDWASLDENQRAAMAQEALRKAGLEQDWAMFKKSQDVGFLDVLGAITGTARAGVETYGAGKKSGLWG